MLEEVKKEARLSCVADLLLLVACLGVAWQWLMVVIEESRCVDIVSGTMNVVVDPQKTCLKKTDRSLI